MLLSLETMLGSASAVFYINLVRSAAVLPK